MLSDCAGLLFPDESWQRAASLFIKSDEFTVFSLLSSAFHQKFTVPSKSGKF